MLKQTDLPDTPDLILQRLDKIAAELQLLRQTVIDIQGHVEKIDEPGAGLTDSEIGNRLPDLREFRASLTVQGDSLRALILREREEQRY